MSSIFGKCNTKEKTLSESELPLMQHKLDYWDANDRNTWQNGQVGLGCLMLCNTPESLHEKLPFCDNHNQLYITADARIDNRDEIFQLVQLNTPGERQLPDGQLIQLLYQKYGPKGVEYLIGDFAFAIWDGRNQKLFCARDHMGVKPFFYYIGDGFFAFATEKKGLLCLPGIDKTIDKQYLANQLLYPSVQAADTTLYKKIKRLAPAHSLTFYPSENKTELHQYWTLDPYTETTLARKEDYYDGLLHHFEQAVKCRVRSAYPVGAELSGGLDSSAITGAAHTFLSHEGREIHTFSNVLGNKSKLASGMDERPFAEAVIAFNKITDYEFVTDDIWDNVLEEIDFALHINDGLEMASLLWLLPIKKAAMQKNIRTILSGFPGDEMATYRGQFYFLDYLDQKQYAKYITAKSRKGFKKLKPFLSPQLEFLIHKVKNFAQLSSPEIKRLFEAFDIPPALRFTKGDVAWQDTVYLERFNSYRHFQKYRLLKPQVALRMEAETRFGLTYKIEPRYPMADIRLAQYYLSMPNAMKHEGGISRTAYRNAVKKYLPTMVLEREGKSGNIAPFKTTEQYKAARKNTLQDLLTAYSVPAHNGAKITLVKNKNIDPEPLELLRWFLKNGGV